MRISSADGYVALLGRICRFDTKVGVLQIVSPSERRRDSASAKMNDKI